MTTGGNQKDTDTAVLEQHYGSKWIVLTWVGPDRPEMLFNPTRVLKVGSLRLRYLNNV